MSKIALILCSSDIDAPYLNFYVDVLKRNYVEYDVICWNRKKNMEKPYPSGYYVYEGEGEGEGFRRLLNLFKYSLFVKTVLRRNKYDKVVALTLSAALFQSIYLSTVFKSRYIVDIRDYTPLITIPFAKSFLARLIRNSGGVCLSSMDFQKWLPVSDKYIQSHNVSANQIKSIEPLNIGSKDVITILTIGQLRDFEANKLFIDTFANKPNYKLIFAGKGPASEQLESYCKENDITNTNFTGYYKKSEENDIARRADFINSILPDNILSRHLLTNRLYLSAVMGKPMIINAGNYQADVVKQFGLGVVVENDMISEVENYVQSFDSNLYDKNRLSFIEHVKREQQFFEQTVSNFVLY